LRTLFRFPERPTIEQGYRALSDGNAPLGPTLAACNDREE
jgi:hypothetical protein